MTALFLKYRPQTFADLVGQTSIRQTLQNALKNEKPGHAYLFTGSRGTGKTSTARIFAKGLNCTNLIDGNPCGECDMCKGTAEGRLIDVVEIDAASNRGIDEIRDLRDKISFAPSIAKRKVYIIDEVHMLTKEAFNALLKTLEEPPDHAYFCLATTELHKVPETIISRCQTFQFGTFTLKELADRLRFVCESESIQFEEGVLDIIAKKAEGGLRDALSLLEQVAVENQQTLTVDNVQTSLGISDSETLEQLYQALQSGNQSAAIEIVHHLVHKGLDLRSFGHDFLLHNRAIILEKVAQNQSPNWELGVVSIFQKALQELKYSPILELPLEIACIKACQINNSVETAAPAPVQPKAPTPPPIAPTPSPTPVIAAEKSPQPTVTPPNPKPAPVAAQPVTSSGSGNVASQMKEIADSAGLPAFVKKSFLTTKVQETETTITFVADSEFHREKLDTASHKDMIRQGLQKICGIEKDVVIEKGHIHRLGPPQNNTASGSANGNEASADDFLVF